MYQYDEKFYKLIEQTNRDEKIIIPLIMQWISPKSIVDFGCAEGIWLKEALLHNEKVDIFGIDGEYVDKQRLKIPERNFRAADLRQRIILGRRFDLAISTEVAEHLEERFADIFVDNITYASDQILFSAAVPGQQGTHHINEQWQSYWIKKFEERGYYYDDSVRNYFWEESEIRSWRKQNIMFFTKKRKSIAPPRRLLDVVHPEEAIQKKVNWINELKIADYYLLHPEIIIRMEEIIQKLINRNKKIVICPYGRNGKLCERILSEKYGVKDYIIADNYITDDKKDIFLIKQLQGISETFGVIDTCSNKEVHTEILCEIHKYVKEKDIYSAF